jgi:hypothetical protein
MTDHEAARRLLRELLPELLDEALRARPALDGHAVANGHRAANGHHAANGSAPPPVPAPPVASVLRPSTWSATPAPGEVVGGAAPTEIPVPAAPAPSPRPVAPAPGGTTESVVLDTDEDLDRFVRSLVARFENPRDRMAIRSGTLRFALRRPSPAGAPGDAVLRVEKGAVTERTVNDAAKAGARLVLAPGAVLTPLARDRARVLKVHVERERRC